MKIQVLFTAVLASALLGSCNKKEELCNYNGKEVPCGYYRVYNQFKANEEAINATFGSKYGPEPPYMSLEDRYELRKTWVTYYDAKKDSIVEARKIMGDTLGELDNLVEMRKGEIGYFEQSLATKKKTQEDLKKMNFSHEMIDREAYGSTRKVVKMTFANTTTDTIGGFNIAIGFKDKEGKMLRKKSVTYMPAVEDIRPNLDSIYYVPPGSEVDIFASLPRGAEDQVDSYDIDVESINYKITR